MESSGQVSASQIFCSCHGSAFDGNGALVQGPANSPLDHFAVTIDAAGAITIDADTVVDPSDRTPVA
jgi:Rieske Fe-S protein